MIPDPAAIDFSRLGPGPDAHVVIAGGCGGIGRAVVKACLATGTRTTVLDLKASHDRHPTPHEAAFVAIDAHSEASIIAAYQQVGEAAEIDALINLVWLP